MLATTIYQQLSHKLPSIRGRSHDEWNGYYVAMLTMHDWQKLLSQLSVEAPTNHFGAWEAVRKALVALKIRNKWNY